MQVKPEDLDVQRLGPCRIDSPVSGVRYVNDGEKVVLHSNPDVLKRMLDNGEGLLAFEKAGPREKIYFDAAKLKCGVVTCGGLCPGLNDVIRALVLSLFHNYKVKNVFGFPYGYEGLTHRYGHAPVELTPAAVSRIHEYGGTILGSSRGNQDIGEMVDTLDRMNLGILFALGGDGTLRGAQAIAEEIGRRGLKISVIGIPKTIDNDISYVERSFGFETAVSGAVKAIDAAHTEAKGARNGIGLVKLMGRESGFIAVFASLARSDVNFCLIPEVPFRLEKLLQSVRDRLERSGHAVIVVAEGAGQELMGETGQRDASGNVKFKDIGLFLKDRINAYFQTAGMDSTLKYIDPSYTIRGVPANAYDSAFCLLLGQNAVHAGMAGRTNMVVGYWMNTFTHVPIPLAVSARKKVDPNSWVWSSVLTSTGQPKEMR
ncbi:MAG: ATP-dependent 6-phosphofructokinase [Desulfobacterales bacterium]|jgi:6-phosphofructokinase 1|nr:ATP-dependent 6-phosphofructokinase [Desulfobacterales bacterium]